MEIKYLQNVNLKSLPNIIKVEFDEVNEEYMRKSIILPGDNDYNYFAIHTKTFQKLKKMLLNDELFTSLHPNVIINDSKGIIKYGFEEVEYKNEYHTNYYKFKNEAYFDWYMVEFYRSGFSQGYDMKFNLEDSLFEDSKNELIKQNILNTVYKRSVESKCKTELLFDNDYDNIDVLSPYLFYEFGKQEGEFIRAWDIILRNPKAFEKAFDNLDQTYKFKIDEIDLSDSKGTEKIIFLKQLGILDFLREKQPFNLSTNALASALSGITGIKHKTLQSYINPIDNPTAKQKNNPLKNKKLVNEVNQKLISLGYIQTE